MSVDLGSHTWANLICVPFELFDSFPPWRLPLCRVEISWNLSVVMPLYGKNAHDSMPMVAPPKSAQIPGRACQM